MAEVVTKSRKGKAHPTITWTGEHWECWCGYTTTDDEDARLHSRGDGNDAESVGG